MQKETTVQELIGQASPEQIAKWKAEHKEIFAVTVDGHVCYLRKPDRAVMAYATTALKEGPYQYAEALFDNCKIGGSEIFDTNDDFYMAALQKVDVLEQVKKAEIVKL